MSDNIFNDRFVGASGLAAWHQLGTVYPERETITATDAYERHVGYKVEEVPLYFPDGTAVEGYKAIVRQPTQDDPVKRVFSVVTSDYTTLHNPLICSMWDRIVRNADNLPVGIETMGALGRGEIFFLTSKMPAFAVAGDTVNSYLLLENDMQGKQGVGVYVVNVRVVCQNTLWAAKNSAVSTYNIVHGAQVEEDTEAWLSHLWEHAYVSYELQKGIFGTLAQVFPNPAEVEEYKLAVYPELPEPQEADFPQSIYERRHQQWEGQSERNYSFRNMVQHCWEGHMPGYDTVNRVPQTAWDLWQAQTYPECHLSPKRQVSPVRRAEAVMNGSRKRNIELGFEKLQDLFLK
jgi:hypothetical protein